MLDHEVAESACVDFRRHTAHRDAVFALFGPELDRLLESEAPITVISMIDKTKLQITYEKPVSGSMIAIT